MSGVPLPFVSFGGSSLVFTMVGAGVLANIAQAEQVTDGRTFAGPTFAGADVRAADVSGRTSPS